MFVYSLESHPTLAELADHVMREIHDGSLAASASVLSLTEHLTKPYQRGDLDRADWYWQMLNAFPNLRVWPVDSLIAREAARIRGMYNVRLPDAVHLASAIASGAETFITNDRLLRSFPELRVTVLADLALN